MGHEEKMLERLRASDRRDMQLYEGLTDNERHTIVCALQVAIRQYDEDAKQLRMSGLQRLAEQFERQH